ncbi:carbohydrate ABC transporter permease [Liquorilactobacillus vini]|uniref:carbohydrate ABC transporter permease n=2 Tax=Liquorilactobacillus vini TaxID=238015 RepID=UPI001F462B62|nr:carbohydrate ABC transporter permease [Liquorilactobacillus vini]
MLLNSFAKWTDVDKSFIPAHYTLRSWKWLFSGGSTGLAEPWLAALGHTFFVTTVSVLFMMVFSSMAAYALAKIRFRGKKFINGFIIFQMFFPAMILLIPQFLEVTKVGWSDTFKAMILPTAVSMWAIFMYTNFFKAIPDSLIEAAKLDGATDLQILMKIVIPMSKSITTVIFLFLYTERWTTLLWDMIISKSNRTVTLNVLLSSMFGPYGSYAGPMYAASVMLTTPLIILFLIFSRNFQKGMQFALK